MPSDAAKKRAQKKKELAKRKGGKQQAAAEKIEETKEEKMENEMAKLEIDRWAVTGVLASHPISADLHIHNYSCTFHGQMLFHDTSLELNHGNKYGLIGVNGCGKSTMLATLGHRSVPIPDHIDSYFLREEAEALDDWTPIRYVLNVNNERTRLEKEVCCCCCLLCIRVLSSGYGKILMLFIYILFM